MSTTAVQAERGTGHGEERGIERQEPSEADARRAATLAEAVRRCSQLAEDINAESFGLYFLASQDEARRLAPVFDSSFPGILFVTKTLCGHGCEPLALRLAEATMPLWWRRSGEPPFLTAAARCWAAEVEAPIPDNTGIAFPVAFERGRSGAVVFHGDDMMIDENRLCQTHASCFALFEDITRQRLQDCAKTQQVSKRETECLRLTANGLTSEEIAVSLGLSVHTANQYLTNTAHKLNAVNRIHAVAKALRSGLID